MSSEKKEILKDILLTEQRGNKPSGGRGNTGGSSGTGGGRGNTGGSSGGRNTGGSTGGSQQTNTGGGTQTTTGGQTNTGGGTQTTTGGQTNTGGGTQTSTGGGGTTVTRQDPIGPTTTTKSNADVAFCKCWTSANKFAHDFSEDDRNEMAEEFVNFAQGYGFFISVETNVETKCGDSNCLYYQSPLVKQLALRQISVGKITETKTLYDIWKETIDQKKAAETKPAEPEPQTSKLYLAFTDAADFFNKVKPELAYEINKNKFRTNLDTLEKIYNTQDCKEKSRLYLDLFNKSAHLSFGDPEATEYTDYNTNSKYWWNFLNTLMEIKESLKGCKNELKADIMNSISRIPDTSIWNLNLQRVGYSVKDKASLNKAQSNVQEQSVIRKKLIEYKEMKTLKESVRNKILLTKENKDKKVNKISENLYKIAGDFYNDRYDVFFNKYVKLKESYKKSKMFLMEGASDNFKNAFIRVFKGDEEDVVKASIPWFTNKLGLEGSVKSEVEEKLKNKYSGDDIANLFEDDWSDIVVSAIINNAKSDVSEPTNVMDAIEKALMSNMRSDFKEDLKNSIKNLIYPVQDSRKTEIVNLANELKNALLASKDGEESQEDTDSKVDDIFS